MENKKYQPSRKITTADGTIIYMFDERTNSKTGTS